MNSKTLHITNGQKLTIYLKSLDVDGTFLTWQEMLCEGPTLEQMDSRIFLDIRKKFLQDFYEIEVDEDLVKQELSILNEPKVFSEVVLWFDFDLFCHINMLSVIKLLSEKQVKLPLYLVCSGRVEDEKNLKRLTELTRSQLLDHYKNKIRLLDSDKDLARTLWHIYCGKDHNLLKPYIIKKSSFIYLNSCLKAHLTRFPNQKNGLSVLEENILSIIHDKNVKTKDHLLGYALNFQGYYGYNAIQMRRKINILSLFYEDSGSQIELNRKGHEALMGTQNFASLVNNNMTYGGVKCLDFYFSSERNELIKK
ncbi:DUF1835 domain-containing protein [Bizionia argentinensis JUB59]|uniref:DUF1835 domain-containing protein n=1 Tax=Bizionia argentinensis JUB59 TaxID=1046627 RepID=G2E9N8_9FLAO|nr:hypothetical protein [Bizionia argentinensis]EGV44743.1 DUF1835 domain-containing protein [Bizionia argentinensis JUB59]